MKNKIFRGAMLAFSFSIALGLSSCTNTSSQDDSKKVAEDQNDAKFNNPEQKDAQFVVDAANISLEEIQLGQLAQTRATMDHTKDLGKMMVTDHQKAYDDLSKLAQSKSISVPTAASDAAQNDYKKLSDEKPSDFDKDYCDKMVNGHKDAIDKFEKEAKDGSDTEIKNWANSMLPALRAHLDAAMKCQEECKAMEKNM